MLPSKHNPAAELSGLSRSLSYTVALLREHASSARYPSERDARTGRRPLKKKPSLKTVDAASRQVVCALVEAAMARDDGTWLTCKQGGRARRVWQRDCAAPCRHRRRRNNHYAARQR